MLGFMGAQSDFDITSCSFEEFISFLFNHEVIDFPNGHQGPYPWYIEAEIKFDSTEVVDHYTKLFLEPNNPLSEFSSESLEQGFWAIQSCNLECSASEQIWNTDVPFARRAKCVRSMSSLFAKFFAKSPLETASNMWWDSIAFDYCCENRMRSNGGEDAAMQDVIFWTLESILQQPETHCQIAALHGLGHLMHPETGSLIDNYIRSNASLSEETIEYARAAAEFEIQ